MIDKIKELRATTGAGVLECRDVLRECDGDIERAKELLRRIGRSRSAQIMLGGKSRDKAEGLVAIRRTSDNKMGIVEVDCETNFIANSIKFQSLVKIVKQGVTLARGDIERLKGITIGFENEDGTMSRPIRIDSIIDLNIGDMGEQIVLKRTESMEVGTGLIASYIHNAIADDIGRIGVLVALKTSDKVAGDAREILRAIGKQIAIHIAVNNPEALDVWTKDMVLNASKRLGVDIEIKKYVRFAVGE